ncbi:hypothetical protein D3C71_2141340 [compost metagenome]
MLAVGPVSNYSFGETTKADGWGTMNRDLWEKQIKAYADLGQFSGPVPTVDDVATFSVLDATADVRKSVG